MLKFAFFTKVVRYIFVGILGIVNLIDDMFLQVTRYFVTKTIQRLEKEDHHDTVCASIEMNKQFLKNNLKFLEKENF